MINHKNIHLPLLLTTALLLLPLSGCSHQSDFTKSAVDHTDGSGTAQTAGQSNLLSNTAISEAAAGASVAADTQIRDTDFCLDTVVTITLNGTDDPALLDSCFDKIREYESLFSRTREGSDIWNINHSQGEPVNVHEETAALLQMALYYCELSGGAFDITIAPVVSLWNFTDEESHSIPEREKLAEALRHVDYQMVEVDGTTVTLKDPEASIDLGGIAKGFIADRLKSYLEESGITSGLIDLGGNILAIGTKPGGNPWNIGIRRPFGASSDAIAVIPSDGQSIVTSGTYERYFELEGTIYHHLLDPSDGYPENNGLASVTILSDSSAQGDALSTACFILGQDKGMELIESLENVEALFITEDLSSVSSSGFPE